MLSTQTRKPEAEFPVTDDNLDAPDGAIIYDEERYGWYERFLDRWKLRTDIGVDKSKLVRDTNG